MRKKVISMLTKIMIGFLVGVLVLVIPSFLYFAIVSTGSIREYKDEKGNQIEGSISEKIKIDINGEQNGLFINGKDVNNPVLLFVSSGPGTDDYFLNEKYPDMHIEDEFTVCYWDYRGMGIVYDKNIDPVSIDLNTLVEDTASVTKYLMERFGKEKIYIMAFSGGTNIALKTIEKYPEYYYAYIAMAQVICSGEDNDTLIYQFMKDTFTERGDKKRLNKLEQIVDKKDNGKVECHNWYEFVALLHEAGGGTIMNETEFEGIVVPILRAHCYTMKEKIDYIKGMKMYRTTTLNQELDNKDYRKTDLVFDIPVYFISGDHDYNCPWPLVEEYCDMIDASDKEFYLIENAAHSPLWEQQESCFKILREIKKKTSEDLRLHDGL
ncbi:MAG: alpha/beta hydrolase [Clostridia bacterium]|nr:alpha/beta hydrolase [Clostridia bacterium]